MSLAEFESLVTALEKAPVVGSLKELAAVVVQQLPSLTREEIGATLRSVFSLSAHVADEETPLSENLASLATAMQASGKPDLALSDDERAQFVKRLDRLLRIQGVILAAKVQRLRLEYPKTFHDAIIVTDMRPVFDKVEDRPAGCVISETLIIVYHEDGEHKEFHVVLDADDLQTMKKVLERAEIKAASLKSVLKVANLPDLT
jgi:hypothetical protein